MVKGIKKYNKPFLDKAFEPKSRPDNYPIPEVDNLLFFIQRNYNFDTIVYQTNFDPSGLININEPIAAYWIKYGGGGIKKDLNYLQKKLAYGYTFEQIATDLFEFEFVSYPKRFFLAKQECGQFKVTTDIAGTKSFITHAYIYAEENGIFPDVKFIELYGTDMKNGEKVYEKLIIE